MLAVGRRKRVVRIGRDEALRRLDEITTLLWGDLNEAIKVEAALEVSNGWFKDKGPFRSYPAHCIQTIRISLTRDLALRVFRFFDLSLRRRINEQDKASLPVLVHLLRQKRCRDALIVSARTRARTWKPGRITEQDCGKAIDRAIHVYAQLRRSTQKRHWLHDLKSLRDAKIAHRLFDQPIGRIPQYQHMFDL